MKAGIVDDPAAIRPAAQSWTDAAVPWARIKDGLTAHDKGHD